MDHLKATRNFTLQHLRFLVRSASTIFRGQCITDFTILQVIDEADRLLSQNFNDWLKVLNERIQSEETPDDEAEIEADGRLDTEALPAYASAPHALGSFSICAEPELKLTKEGSVSNLCQR